MKIFSYSHLEDSQKKAVQSLVDSCSINDRAKLSFPFEEGELFLLAKETEDSSLLAAMAFTLCEPGLYECSAFTLPAARRQGLFSELLETGLTLLPEESELLFYIPEICVLETCGPETEDFRKRASKACGGERGLEALQVLKSLDAELVGKEHLMILDSLPLFLMQKAGRKQSAKKDTPATAAEEATEAAAAEAAVSQLVLEDGSPILQYGSEAGALTILPLENGCCLYDFEIKEAFRGQGKGRALLYFALSDLFSRGLFPVRLQVSGNNAPALSLYKKTGFRITETLLSYIY